jgi:nicotinamidase-related amidase
MSSSRTALVLIDFQEWIVRDLVAEGGRDAAVAAARAATQARDRGDLVVHVQYLHLDGSDGGPGATETRFLDSIEVLPADPIITKYGRCAFEGTELDTILDREGIRRVLLAGVVTEGGVEATARSALTRGYQVGVLSDAVAGNTPAGHVQALKSMTEAGIEILGPEQRSP